MASITQQIGDALAADPEIAAIVAGRVYVNRPIKKTGVGATPEAYDANGLMKLSLVVVDDGDLNDLWREDAAEQTVTVWMHGPLTATARETIAGVLQNRVMALSDREFVGLNGTGTQLSVMSRFGLRPDPTVENSYVDYVRFSVARLWR